MVAQSFHLLNTYTDIGSGIRIGISVEFGVRDIEDWLDDEVGEELARRPDTTQPVHTIHEVAALLIRNRSNGKGSSGKRVCISEDYNTCGCPHIRGE